MGSDTQFTALGPTQIGFQCHGANIGVGGTKVGNEFGVQARCGNALSTQGAAVHGQSETRNGNGIIAAAHIGSQAYGLWPASAEGFAGFFDEVRVNGDLQVNSNVQVNGNLTVTGMKSAAVGVADGSLRLTATASGEEKEDDPGTDQLLADVVAGLAYQDPAVIPAASVRMSLRPSAISRSSSIDSSRVRRSAA